MSPMGTEPIQIKENIHALRQLAYMGGELTKLQCAWIPGTAWWELKLYLARCQWENAEHANKLRGRLKEFPGGKPDGAVDKRLTLLMEVLAAAPSGPAFIEGVFGVFKPRLVEWYRQQKDNTDQIVDLPTVVILDQAIREEEAQIRQAMSYYAQWPLRDEEKKEAQAWREYIVSLLPASLATLGNQDAEWPGLQQVERYRPSPVGLRDERFTTSFREEPPIDDSMDEGTKLEIIIVCSYLKEMQATETVATSLYETLNMPWEFYYETARHCWDEARHCMLGQRRLEQLGFDITTVKSMNANYAVRQLLDPLYRYTYITMVEEAGSMKWKRNNVLRLEELGKTLTARLVEYDLADERNHVENGFRWIPKILESRGDARTLEQVVAEARHLREQAFELIRIDYESS